MTRSNTDAARTPRSAPRRAPSRSETEARDRTAGHPLLDMQRRAGNRAVGSMLRGHESAGERGDPASVFAATRRGGSALAGPVRTSMERSLGRSFADVRVHDGPTADRLTRSMDANAMTAGRHVFFRTGRYRPGTPAGRSLIAHELTHVVQQRAGAAVSGGRGRPGDRWEQQADAVASRVRSGRSAADLLPARAPGRRVQPRPAIQLDRVSAAQRRRDAEEEARRAVLARRAREAAAREHREARFESIREDQARLVEEARQIGAPDLHRDWDHKSKSYSDWSRTEEKRQVARRDIDGDLIYRMALLAGKAKSEGDPRAAAREGLGAMFGEGDLEPLIDRVLALDFPEVSPTALELAREGRDGVRVPLGYADPKSADRDMAMEHFKSMRVALGKELVSIGKKLGIPHFADRVVIRQIGSGTTGWSGNPSKWMTSGNLPAWKPTSDMDFSVYSPDLVMRYGAALRKNEHAEVFSNGRKGRYRGVARKKAVIKGFHDRSAGRRLRAFEDRWSRTIYKRMGALRSPGLGARWAAAAAGRHETTMGGERFEGNLDFKLVLPDSVVFDGARAVGFHWNELDKGVLVWPMGRDPGTLQTLMSDTQVEDLTEEWWRSIDGREDVDWGREPEPYVTRSPTGLIGAGEQLRARELLSRAAWASDIGREHALAVEQGQGAMSPALGAHGAQNEGSLLHLFRHLPGLQTTIEMSAAGATTIERFVEQFIDANHAPSLLLPLMHDAGGWVERIHGWIVGAHEQLATTQDGHPLVAWLNQLRETDPGLTDRIEVGAGRTEARVDGAGPWSEILQLYAGASLVAWLANGGPIAEPNPDAFGEAIGRLAEASADRRGVFGRDPAGVGVAHDPHRTLLQVGAGVVGEYANVLERSPGIASSVFTHQQDVARDQEGEPTGGERGLIRELSDIARLRPDGPAGARLPLGFADQASVDRFLEAIRNHLNVYPVFNRGPFDVCIYGSSLRGAAYSPRKRHRAFGPHSDYDIAIVGTHVVKAFQAVAEKAQHKDARYGLRDVIDGPKLDANDQVEVGSSREWGSPIRRADPRDPSSKVKKVGPIDNRYPPLMEAFDLGTLQERLETLFNTLAHPTWVALHGTAAPDVNFMAYDSAEVLMTEERKTAFAEEQVAVYPQL